MRALNGRPYPRAVFRGRPVILLYLAFVKGIAFVKYAVIQRARRGERLHGGAGGIQALRHAVDERLCLVVQKPRIIRARYAAGEQVYVVARVRIHGLHSAGFGVHNHHRARRGFPEKGKLHNLLHPALKVHVYCQLNVAAILRVYFIKRLSVGAFHRADIHKLAVPAAQLLLVLLLKPQPAHAAVRIVKPVPLGAAFVQPVQLRLKLFLGFAGYCANVAHKVRKQLPVRIFAHGVIISVVYAYARYLQKLLPHGIGYFVAVILLYYGNVVIRLFKLFGYCGFCHVQQP